MLPTTKRFAKVNLEISNICNLQCSFCPEVLREKKMMSLDLFRRAIEQVAPLTELVCLHLMGEPLTHPQLKEFVDICAEFNTRLFLVSNGILLREDKFDLLLHPVFQQVNFSLHSFADNHPGTDPTNYLEKIFRFTELAFQQRPDLYLNYRLWNLDDQSRSHTDNTQVLEKVCARFNIPVPLAPDVRRRKSIPVKNRLYLHFDTEFTWPSMDLPVIGTAGRCHGLSSHFGILADGRVVPCCLDKEATIELGNIAETPILEILASPRAQQILEGFRQKKLVESLCQRCQYIERFQPAVKSI